jgi:hypothetical protein
MSTFTVTPNLRTLNRYLTSSTDEEFDHANPGFQLKAMLIESEWSVFKDTTFTKRFTELLEKFQLLSHYDNLLYLTLHIYDQIWSGIQLAYDLYEQKKRARELAQLILTLKETKEGKLDLVTFKSLTHTSKVTDSKVNDWISVTLIKALEEKLFKVGEFGVSILEMLTDKEGPFDFEPVNLHKLKKYATMRLVNPKNRIRKGMVSITLVIHSYLQEETNLQANNKSGISDEQLIFLFELLELLQMISSIEIDSEPKDYLRTTIQNYVNISN